MADWYSECFCFFLPSLYGDGYHEIKALLATDSLGFQSFIVLVLVVFFKPIVTGLTLQLGGDGGVFAPSIFSGALLGAIMSYVSMYFFQIEASAISFIILGVAFTVAATLHAPLTAIFLTFGIFHSCQMALPICTLVFVSYYLSKRIYPHTVYTLALQKETSANG